MARGVPVACVGPLVTAGGGRRRGAAVRPGDQAAVRRGRAGCSRPGPRARACVGAAGRAPPASPGSAPREATRSYLPAAALARLARRRPSARAVLIVRGQLGTPWELRALGGSRRTASTSPTCARASNDSTDDVASSRTVPARCETCCREAGWATPRPALGDRYLGATRPRAGRHRARGGARVLVHRPTPRGERARAASSSS